MNTILNAFYVTFLKTILTSLHIFLKKVYQGCIECSKMFIMSQPIGPWHMQK